MELSLARLEGFKLSSSFQRKLFFSAEGNYVVLEQGALNPRKTTKYLAMDCFIWSLSSFNRAKIKFMRVCVCARLS